MADAGHRIKDFVGVAHMKAKEVDGKDGIRRVRIDCPGCKEKHIIPVSGPDAWEFYGQTVELPEVE